MNVRVSPPPRLCGVLTAGILLAAAASALAEAGVDFDSTPGAFPLVDRGAAATLWVDARDWPGVVRAAGDLQADVERVAGIRPALDTAAPVHGRVAVIIGTVGHSALIDGLVRSRKLDARAIRGRWEAFLPEVVANPLPGVERALVIAGSDKRGTIYGIYDLSSRSASRPGTGGRMCRRAITPRCLWTRRAAWTRARR